MDLIHVQESTAIDIELTSSTFDIAGYRTIRNYGIVRGITVRSRNLCATVSAIICSFGGGHNPFFTHLCEQSREEAIGELRVIFSYFLPSASSFTTYICC